MSRICISIQSLPESAPLLFENVRWFFFFFLLAYLVTSINFSASALYESSLPERSLTHVQQIYTDASLRTTWKHRITNKGASRFGAAEGRSGLIELKTQPATVLQWRCLVLAWLIDWVRRKAGWFNGSCTHLYWLAFGNHMILYWRMTRHASVTAFQCSLLRNKSDISNFDKLDLRYWLLTVHLTNPQD